MPRTYKADPNKKRYKKYEPDVLSNALRELKESNESLQKIADKYNIHKSVLYRHSKKKIKTQGGQTELSYEAEQYIVENIYMW